MINYPQLTDNIFVLCSIKHPLSSHECIPHAIRSTILSDFIHYVKRSIAYIQPNYALSFVVVHLTL